MPKASNLRQVLDDIRNFIRYLNRNMSTDLLEEFPAILISNGDGSSLMLQREEAKEYRTCLRKLIDVINVDGLHSPKLIEDLFEKAILDSLDISDRQTGIPFRKRLSSAIEDLRSSVQKPLGRFEVYYPVNGLEPDGLPIPFGRVNFEVLDTSRLRQYWYKDDGSDEAKITQEWFNRMVEWPLGKKPVGRIQVIAQATDAARFRAKKELRRTIDVANFFSTIIPYSDALLSLAGDMERVIESAPVVALDEARLDIRMERVGPAALLSLPRLMQDSEKLGISTAIRILSSNEPNELESRLLASLQWAGRANADSRNEEAFLHYAIALESLFVPLKGDQITTKLSDRVAAFFAINEEAIAKIKKRAKNLYDTRSLIVHRGQYDVTDNEINKLRYITQNCIVGMLLNEQVSAMTKLKELDIWLDGQPGMPGNCENS